jgi:CRP-like cAMP-binding protein
MNMLIDSQILVASGAVFRKHEKGKMIFQEGLSSLFYYQIVSGRVAIVNQNEDGSEFIQGIYGDGQSFGTSALFLGEPFPASAMAITDTVLIRLGRDAFLKLLREYPDVLLTITRSLARKLYHHALIGKGIAIQGPEERINTLMDVMKKESGCATETKYRLCLSRQQIADMVGLRVETVIRAMKKLEQKGVVAIEHGKVFY